MAHVNENNCIIFFWKESEWRKFMLQLIDINFLHLLIALESD